MLSTPSYSNPTDAAPIDLTTRSRTSLFLSYRNSRAPRSRFAPSRTNSRFIFDADQDAEQDDEDEDDMNTDLERTGLLRSNGKHTKKRHADPFGQPDLEYGIPPSAASSLPPAWVDISDRVEEILKATRLKIATLDKLHTKHALPGFADRSAEEREIEKLTTEITRDFRQAHTLIQKVKPETSASSRTGNGDHNFPPSRPVQPTAQAILAAKNVQRGLAAQVQETSALLRKKQRVYMDKLQGHAIKNQDLLIASGAISLRGSEGLSALEDDVEASRFQHATSQQAQQMINSDINVQQRARELEEIAKSIDGLAELFKDLSTLVIEQGTILDSIEYNIERTADAMEGAVRELDVAKGYQRSAGRRQCICLLLLLILGAIIVLIFKPKRHSSPSTSSISVGSILNLDSSPDTLEGRHPPLSPFAAM